MIDGKFTAKERAYLASLPAVKSVSPSHIRYTDRFKVEVMCRYNAGESPSAIFREAGLDPKLIGYKRVERCIARWKQQEERNKRRNEHTNHYMQDCDDELEAIELRGDDVDQSVVDLYGAGAAGTSGRDIVANRQETMARRAECNVVQSLRLGQVAREHDCIAGFPHGERARRVEQLTVMQQIKRHADSRRRRMAYSHELATTCSREVHPATRAKRTQHLHRTEGADPTFSGGDRRVRSDMRRRRRADRRTSPSPCACSAAVLIVIPQSASVGFPGECCNTGRRTKLSNTSDRSAQCGCGLAVSAGRRRNRRGQGIQQTARHIGAADPRRGEGSVLPVCSGSSVRLQRRFRFQRDALARQAPAPKIRNIKACWIPAAA